jgi:hypothetical protein
MDRHPVHRQVPTAAAAAAAAASGVQSFAAAVAAAVAAVGLMPQSAVLRASDAPKIMQCCSYLYYIIYDNMINEFILYNTIPNGFKYFYALNN